VDHLSRVTGALLVLLVAVLVGAPVSAHAFGSVSKSSQRIWYVVGTGVSVGNVNPVAACQLHTGPSATLNGFHWAYSDWSFEASSETAGLCRYKVLALECSGACTTWSLHQMVSEVVESCPGDSSAAGGSSCTCDSGFQPGANNTCKPTNCTSVEQGASSYQMHWSGTGTATCYQGCMFSCSYTSYNSASNKSFCVTGAAHATGESCMGSNQTGTTEGTGTGAGGPASSCPTGQCPGEVNGQSVCVPCKVTTPPVTTSASAPSGMTPPPLDGVPGATSKEKKTEYEGSKCETTTTYRNPAGETVGETKESQEKDSFCSQNPGLSICKDGSFGGACGGFTCNGDAVQCAMAKGQYERACEFFQPSGLAVDAGVNGANGEDQPTGHPGTVPVTTAFGNQIEQTDLLAGSCPGDFSISVMGKSVAVPMSKICEPLSQLGSAAVAGCLLAAAFIVFRR